MNSPSPEPHASDLFTFDVEHEGSRAVFRLQGELDLYPLPRLREAFEIAVDRGAREVTLHLAGLTFLGSTGMNFFVQADRRLREVGGVLRIEHIPAVVYRLLEIAGLHQLLHLELGDSEGSGETESV